jgi:hypothetical protein
MGGSQSALAAGKLQLIVRDPHVQRSRTARTKERTLPTRLVALLAVRRGPLFCHRSTMSHYRRFYCSPCEQVRRFRKPAPDHALHLRFTLLTLGAWGIGWLILSILAARRHWRCTFCHARPGRGNLLEAPPSGVWRTREDVILPADSPAPE